ncbi:RGS domain-containing protein [Gorgonomyces haynaldii]|nr:RGS domain-containing protein [Gorgonomyces haynaldii]
MPKISVTTSRHGPAGSRHSIASSLGGKMTMAKLLARTLEPPYSYQDYYEYLKITHSEENLEFLDAVRQYQQQAIKVFPYKLNKNQSLDTPMSPRSPPPQDVDPTQPVQGSLSDEEFEKLLAKLKAQSDAIYDTWISNEAPREVNLPYKIKKPFMDWREKQVLHPDIYNASFDHILMMLQNDNFKRFISPDRVAQKSISPVSPLVQQVQEDVPTARKRSVSDKMKGFFKAKK